MYKITMVYDNFYEASELVKEIGLIVGISLVVLFLANKFVNMIED